MIYFRRLELLLVVQLAFRKCVLQMYVLMCKWTYSWAASLSAVQSHEDIYIMLFRPWTFLHIVSVLKTILRCSIFSAVSKSPFHLRAFLRIKKCLPLQQAPLFSKLSFLHIHYLGCNQVTKQLVVDFSASFYVSHYIFLIPL